MIIARRSFFFTAFVGFNPESIAPTRAPADLPKTLPAGLPATARIESYSSVLFLRRIAMTPMSTTASTAQTIRTVFASISLSFLFRPP
jgi:hypothetical protein